MSEGSGVEVVCPRDDCDYETIVFPIGEDAREMRRPTSRECPYCPGDVNETAVRPILERPPEVRA